MRRKSFLKEPSVTVPKFDDMTDSWLEFKGIFEFLVHSDHQIHSIEKLHYLKAALKGKTVQIVMSIDLNIQGYHIPWNTLCLRYNNNRIDTNVKVLLNLEAVSKDFSKEFSSSGSHALIYVWCTRDGPTTFFTISQKRKSTTVDEMKPFAMSSLKAETMLSTVRVAVLDKYGGTHKTWVLLDSAFQASFMAKVLFKILKIEDMTIYIDVLI